MTAESRARIVITTSNCMHLHMERTSYTILRIAVILLLLVLSCLGLEDCGRRPPIPRVIGGDEAIPHSWPWQARIILQDKNGTWKHKCGASLIHPEWIVTAAHCLAFHPDPRIYRVILGDHDWAEKEPSEQYFEVSQMYINRLYQTISGYGHDIALIKLSRPAILNNDVNLVCLPKQNNRVAIGKMCYLTGWGVSTPKSTEKNPKLQQARLPTVNYSTCWTGNSFFQPIDDETMLCAGFGGEKTISGCNGDSGGPLVCEEDGKFVLRGAVSWGIPRCPGGRHYSVFARVSSFVEWIEHHIKNSDIY